MLGKSLVNPQITDQIHHYKDGDKTMGQKFNPGLELIGFEQPDPEVQQIEIMQNH